MAKFRLRLLLNSIPFLDGLRLSVLAWICDHGTTFFDVTYKVTRVMSPAAREFMESRRPAIFAIYHGRMIGLLRLLWPRKQLTILMSQSRDGEIIARAGQGLGYSIARGSPGRGAVEGAMQLISSAEAGQSLALTVDGPRGPIFSVKPGIIRIAELTKLPIIPFVCSGRTSQHMWGWDRFMACCWGSPIIYIFGDPIYVRPGLSDDEREQIRQQLDSTMGRLRQIADGYWDATGKHTGKSAAAV